MRKIIQPCGLHCIKMNHLGVTISGQEILTDINLHIHCGTLNAVIGKNGAGKSTLIKAVLGELPHTGSIKFMLVNDMSCNSYRPHKSAGINESKDFFVRRYKDQEDGQMQKLKIGYVPQNINIEKHTPVSVYDLIASYQSHFPVFLSKKKRLYEEIKSSLRVFEADDLIDKQVCNLSGGQMQRVLLSLAVMDEPNLLLLDEPVSGIDQNGMELFYQLIDHLKRSFDLAVILISHDLDYVAKYADWVVLLDKTVLKQGSVREVYQSREFEQVFGVTEVYT